MSPADLAAHHLDQAKWATTDALFYEQRRSRVWGNTMRKRRRFHLRAALLIISRCSGGKTREEAKQLMGRVR